MLRDHGRCDVSRGGTGGLYCYWSDACSGCGGDGIGGRVGDPSGTDGGTTFLLSGLSRSSC